MSAGAGHRAHRFRGLAAGLACLLAAGFARAAVPLDGSPVLPRLQDSLRLGGVTSAAMPPDGLLTFGLGLRTCSTVYLVDGWRERVARREYFLQAEWSPLPWLQAWGEVPWRTWSGGAGWIPDSGSGLGDGQWQVAAGRSLGDGALHLALLGGGNLPVGRRSEGLGEGVWSPQAGGALTMCLWRDRHVPEMRLHLNASRTWNRAEDTGYGWLQQGFEPWPSRYPAADAVGGNGGNDVTTLGGALEFRRGSTSLWVDYTRDRFPQTAAVAPREQFSGVGAGLRWGLSEGWALAGSYLVSLARDDAATAWYPAFPDWSMSIALSRQFPLGGRDRDHDGIVDRRDACRDLAEDHDGFRDDDGCPDTDNDHDGIPDVRDIAPDKPEDRDGFMDLDGAPDPDNDADGVPDLTDLCPDKPEDLDGDADDDGCPEALQDADRDGVPDDRDACPEAIEDYDGFTDQDGCPDPDNDLDGIEDTRDACPDQAEDYNGVQDSDGCPDGAPAPKWN